MHNRPRIEFVSQSHAGADSIDKDGATTLVVFAGAGLAMGEAAAALLAPASAHLARAAAAAKFKGNQSGAMDILAPAGIGVDRLLVAGVGPGKGDAAAKLSMANLGGAVMGRIATPNVAVLFDMPAGVDASPDAAAEFMLGMRLRAYKFDLYKTRKKDDAEPEAVHRVNIGVADPVACRKAAIARDAVADGVILARNLVNEPPNVLFPVEFAARAKALEELGVEIDILDDKAMAKLGMGALLAVGQGSERESRTVVMRWRGAKGIKDKDGKARPIAFIGKGVCFDTGGISIKPGAGMEDMKGDMGGAACVTGLMHALAARKAKVDVIGAIGIVENMPDGKAYRPGDIVKSMSGQTIEIINTDAEGRLVLADVLWHIQDKYKPAFMVDLATLTGAILVALGPEQAGLFSNNDELSERLSKAGELTGEKVWRMPMGPAYDKMIDSKFADMKNTGGRHGGSITAAQFLQRHVNDTPWAHLDIAGTAMSSTPSDINQSWGSGWGVRLLDRLVSEYYES